VKLPFGLSLVLCCVWLLWSGHLEPLLVALGIGSVVAVVAVARRMRLIDSEGTPLYLPAGAARFLPWLFWEIAKSNLDVARRILDPRLPIHPMLIRVKAGQSTDLGRAIYANSITLTPGTVAVDLVGDEILVHALSREAAEGLRSGEMDRRVSAYTRRG